MQKNTAHFMCLWPGFRSCVSSQPGRLNKSQMGPVSLVHPAVTEEPQRACSLERKGHWKMQECNRSESWTQLRRLRILYQERKWQYFALISYNFIPEGRRYSLIQVSVLRHWSWVMLDQKAVNFRCVLPASIIIWLQHFYNLTQRGKKGCFTNVKTLGVR